MLPGDSQTGQASGSAQCDIYRLRDKRLEKFDRLFDRFLHITQPLAQGYASTWSFWVERYIKGKVRLVLHLRGISPKGNPVNLFAVFERQIASSSGQSVSGMNRAGADMKAGINSCSNEVEATVLVLNAQLVQQPQRFP